MKRYINCSRDETSFYQLTIDATDTVSAMNRCYRELCEYLEAISVAESERPNSTEFMKSKMWLKKSISELRDAVSHGTYFVNDFPQI